MVRYGVRALARLGYPDEPLAALWHALSRIASVTHDVHLEDLDPVRGTLSLRVTFEPGGASRRARVEPTVDGDGAVIEVACGNRAHRLCLRAGPDGDAWAEEIVTARGTRSRAIASWDERALARLVADGSSGATTLTRASRLARVLDEARVNAPSLTVASGRARTLTAEPRRDAPASASAATSHDARLARPKASGDDAASVRAKSSQDDAASALAKLGLRPRPDAPGPPLRVIAARAAAPAWPAAIARTPTELWPFLAGIKPVVFLTVRPRDEAATRAFFPDTHVERRERRVAVGPGDRWHDDRDRGEPRVELFVSREADLARRAVALQAEADPTLAAEALGALMGYPSCCVRAFAAQADRADNSLDRMLALARTPTTTLPWELDDLRLKLVPFYPCSYTCPRALAYARRVLDTIEAYTPGAREALRATLARPVLYFDHDHQVWLDPLPGGGGRGSPRCVGYAGLWSTVGAATDGLAVLLGRGDTLCLEDEALLIRHGKATVATLDRDDPDLAALFCFADAVSSTAPSPGGLERDGTVPQE